MSFKRSKPTFSRRDELITLASYGNVTPEEAEAEASASGWEPFQRSPDPSVFNPLSEPRWSIVMAVAWIAWRDIQLVREHFDKYRAECTLWRFQRWRAPTPDGAGFQTHEGWLLEPLSKTTLPRLALEETFERDYDPCRPPLMSVITARAALWDALQSDDLLAEARGRNGEVVQVPAKEWSFLKPFEERERDVLKYDALDSKPAFEQVKLKRDDLLRLWPRQLDYQPLKLNEDLAIHGSMIEPLTNRRGGFVPLCSVIHWVMSGGGIRNVLYNDEAAWDSAVEELIPLIQDGEIEIIGRPRHEGWTERIPGHTLTVLRVIPPLMRSVEDILNPNSSVIECMAFTTPQLWADSQFDSLYEAHQSRPAWTHLQLRKSQVLKHWPRPQGKVNRELRCYQWLRDEIEKSRDRKPRSKEAFKSDAGEKFPGLKDRQFDRAWTKAIMDSRAEAWSKPGPIRRSIRRTS